MVLEERRMRTDSNPIGRLLEQLLATAYVAHHYGRTGVGWPSEVSQITATEAMAFHKKYYVGSNIVVAVVGDVKAAEAMPMLEKYFGRVPPARSREDDDDGRAQAVCGEDGRHPRADASPSTSRAITGPTIAIPDDAVYDAISDILSNGRVSRLYRSLVRDQQIAAEAAGLQRLSRATSIPACSRFMRCRCRGTPPPRCATRSTRRSKS